MDQKTDYLCRRAYRLRQQTRLHVCLQGLTDTMLTLTWTDHTITAELEQTLYYMV